MKVIRKNTKEDMKLLLSLGRNYSGEDFMLTFRSGRYGVTTYVCSYINGIYTNCEMADDTHVLCLLDNHNLPCGLLSVEVKVCMPDTQMPDGDYKICDTRLVEAIGEDGNPYHIEFTQGASDAISTPEMVWNLLGPVLRGKPGTVGEDQIQGIVVAVMDNLGGIIVPEAPKDGKQYARMDGSWHEVDAMTEDERNKINNAVQPDAIADMETKEHASNTYQPKGDYQPKGEYATSEELSELSKDIAAEFGGKQDTITDLDAIRSGANKGATALQPVEGKQLTTEDFTTALKEKLEGLSNYDDKAVRELISSLSNAIDMLTGTADTTAAIDTFNEIIAFLGTFQNTDNLASVLSALKADVEQWVEGKNYLTEHQDISGKVDKEDGKGLSKVVDAKVVDDTLHITKEDGTELEFQGGGGGGGLSNETVNITVTSDVDGIDVSGIELDVAIDGVKSVVTTDSEGKATFVAEALSEYVITPPYIDRCDPVKPIKRYAGRETREISIVYLPEAEHVETVRFTAYKWIGRVRGAFEGLSVTITYDEETREFITDANGDFSAEIPYGKEYTIEVLTPDGFYVYGGQTSWTRIASEVIYRKIVSLSDVAFEDVGIFLVANDGVQYTREEFVESGRDGSDIVMFRISDAELFRTGNTFGIDLDDITNRSMQSLQWANSNIQFTSYPNGQSSSGLDRTIKLINEGLSRNITTFAASYCYDKQFTLGDTQLQGFLGAVFQHLALVENESQLNALLKLVRPSATKNFSNILGTNRWTIDQTSANGAFYVARTVTITNKSFSDAVLPFYAF